MSQRAAKRLLKDTFHMSEEAVESARAPCVTIEAEINKQTPPT